MANRNTDRKSSGPSQRQLRVGELIRHALAEMLTRGEIHDDVLAEHVVTVSEVRMSPDLKLASIYIMPLGGKDVKPVLEMVARGETLPAGHDIGGNDIRLEHGLRFDPQKETTRRALPRWVEMLTVALCWPLMGRYGYALRRTPRLGGIATTGAGGH